MSSAPLTPTTDEPISPRVARSRKKVLDAATELLVESGPRSVTVDAVAEASGVAKSTLYRHWSSRNELLVDVVCAKGPEIETLDPNMGFEASLRRLITSAATGFAEPQWPRIFSAVTSLRTSMPELDEFIERDVAEKKGAIAAVLDLGVAEGVLPEPVDVDDAINMLIGPLVFSVMTNHGGGHAANGVVELAEYVVDRFLASH